MDRPADFHPLTWHWYRALRGGARLSRNRHFELYKNPRVLEALRLHRYLKGVARDVSENADSVTVTVCDDGVSALRVEFPQVHGRRVAYLKPRELRLLAEMAPLVAHLLSQALDA